jgi:hypothetical protein
MIWQRKKLSKTESNVREIKFNDCHCEKSVLSLQPFRRDLFLLWIATFVRRWSGDFPPNWVSVLQSKKPFQIHSISTFRTAR